MVEFPSDLRCCMVWKLKLSFNSTQISDEVTHSSLNLTDIWLDAKAGVPKYQTQSSLGQVYC